MTASRIDSVVVSAAGSPAVNQRTNRAELVIERGWIHEVLPDRSGFVPRNSSGLHNVDCCGASRAVTASLHELRPEYVVTVEGHRDEEEDGDTGPRLKCTRITVISESQGIPFTAATRRYASPALRAKYRYLEFRDPEMLAVLRARHAVLRTWCQYLDDHGFLQVETPLLAHPSGSGAHEFGVVSQRRDSVRYALAQSAQVYGQLVMAGGVERYYQLCRCFRDEDLHADRQQEFTQLQVEIAFAERDDVIELIEGGLRATCDALGLALPDSILRIPYSECLKVYGTDKPDLRVDVSVEQLPLRLLEHGRRSPLSLVVTRLPDGLHPDVSWWESVRRVADVRGAALTGFLDPGARARDRRFELPVDQAAVQLQLVPTYRPGLAAVWTVRPQQVSRLHAALYDALVRLPDQPPTFCPVWVVDFPLFELAPEGGGLTAANHPFVAPVDECAFAAARTRQELLALPSTSFDLVINGEEVGSGSIINHHLKTQERILELLAVSRQERAGSFGFILESMRYGMPPIAGIGLGVDRAIALMCGKKKIREVMAFPKTKRGYCPVAFRG